MIDEVQLTVDQKLSIIQDLMNQIHSKSGILAVHNQTILQLAPPANPHSYIVAGSDITRRTHTANLQQKVLDAQIQSMRAQEPQKIQEIGDEEIERDHYRFYKNNMRCFRCKKIGHYNYTCPHETTCHFCLAADHNSDKCPQKVVCYQCYQHGHMVNECPQPPGIFCHNCKRRHSGTCGFLTKGTDMVKQLFNRDNSNNSEVRCMSCLEYGHLRCEKGRSFDKGQY